MDFLEKFFFSLIKRFTLRENKKFYSKGLENHEKVSQI